MNEEFQVEVFYQLGLQVVRGEARTRLLNKLFYMLKCLLPTAASTVTLVSNVSLMLGRLTNVLTGIKG